MAPPALDAQLVSLALGFFSATFLEGESLFALGPLGVTQQLLVLAVCCACCCCCCAAGCATVRRRRRRRRVAAAAAAAATATTTTAAAAAAATARPALSTRASAKVGSDADLKRPTRRTSNKAVLEGLESIVRRPSSCTYVQCCGAEAGAAGRPYPPARPPLPAGWEEHFDEDEGSVFYHNEQSGETQWERPF